MEAMQTLLDVRLWSSTFRVVGERSGFLLADNHSVVSVVLLTELDWLPIQIMERLMGRRNQELSSSVNHQMLTITYDTFDNST